MADLKPKEDIHTMIDTSDPLSYIEKFSIALMNWELNKKDKKAVAKSRLIVVRK